VPHLFQVDVEGVVRSVGRDRAGGFLLGVFHLLPVRLDLVLVEELDVEVVQDVHDVLDQLRVGGAVGNDLVDVLDGHVAVLLGKADELLHLLVDVAADDRRGDGLGRDLGRGGGHGLRDRLDGRRILGRRLALRGDLARGLGGRGFHRGLRRRPGRDLRGFDGRLGLSRGFGRLVGGLLVLLVGHRWEIRR